MASTSNIPLVAKDEPKKEDKKDKKTKKDKHVKVDTQDEKKPAESIAALQEPIRELAKMPEFATNIAAVVKKLCERYPEIVWLTSKTNVTPEGIIASKDQKISVQMFGETHIEFDKTIVSIFCLFWVVTGDYDSFVACQAPAARLTKDSFEKLRNYVSSILGDDDGIEALVVFTVLNDLGKVESVVQLVRSKTAVEEVDHDKILFMGLKTNPRLFPRCLRLTKDYQDWLLEGLGAQFNFAQLVQAESVPANLAGLKGLSKMSLDLFNLHALFDMAGAAGHIKYNGSLVLTEATYQDVVLCIKSMELVASRGATVVQVYDSYLHERGKTLGLDVHRPTQRALLRVCCNLRYHTKEQAQVVIAAYEQVPHETWNILRRELCVTGLDDGWAILLYYAPALLLNCQSSFAKPNEPPNVEAIKIGLIAMSKCFISARRHIKDRKSNGAFTADIADIATVAKNPLNLDKINYELQPIGEDGKIVGKYEEETPFK